MRQSNTLPLVFRKIIKNAQTDYDLRQQKSSVNGLAAEMFVDPITNSTSEGKGAIFLRSISLSVDKGML